MAVTMYQLKNLPVLFIESKCYRVDDIIAYARRLCVKSFVRSYKVFAKAKMENSWEAFFWRCLDLSGFGIYIRDV
jgi:hypothetical protein